MERRKVGRPPKLNEENKSELIDKFTQYIEETDIPIIAEFAYKNGLWKQYFYDHAEFTDLIKKATSKKEAVLEKGMITNLYNPAATIFSLKQMGWRDKQEFEHSGTTTNNINLSSLSVQELKNLAKTKSTTT